MDGQSAEVESGMGGSTGGSGTTPSSRWNPTKEQISLLENLYKEGIRTPNAEQIEQITNRLRAYGQIEGKNVFYWFQNHKARQRQRQKQERNAYFNRFLHPSHPTFSSLPCQNVVRTPPYNGLPHRHSELGFYPQHPNVLVPGPISPRTENFVPMMMPPVPISPMTQNVVSMMMPRICDGPPIYDLLQQRTPHYGFCNTTRKTLELFPLHPTGTSEGKRTNQVVSADCYKSNDTLSGSPDIDEDSRRGNQPFFDFFTSGQGPRTSD